MTMDAIERAARKIAATKMLLSNDGERLPDDLWQQCIPHAKRQIAERDYAVAFAAAALFGVTFITPTNKQEVE
jgi:hypothetical protein